MRSPESAFWRFLQEAQVISPERAEAASREVRGRWMPIGRILLSSKCINVPQMLELLRMQEDRPGQRIGDLAVSQGFCTREDVDEAIETQRSSGPHPLQALLEDEALDHMALVEALYGYVRHLEGRAQLLDQLVVEARAEG